MTLLGAVWRVLKCVSERIHYPRLQEESPAMWHILPSYQSPVPTRPGAAASKWVPRPSGLGAFLKPGCKPVDEDFGCLRPCPLSLGRNSMTLVAVGLGDPVTQLREGPRAVEEVHADVPVPMGDEEPASLLRDLDPRGLLPQLVPVFPYSVSRGDSRGHAGVHFLRLFGLLPDLAHSVSI